MAAKAVKKELLNDDIKVRELMSCAKLEIPRLPAVWNWYLA